MIPVNAGDLSLFTGTIGAVTFLTDEFLCPGLRQRFRGFQFSCFDCHKPQRTAGHTSSFTCAKSYEELKKGSMRRFPDAQKTICRQPGPQNPTTC
jgi:hypothetical protein